MTVGRRRQRRASVGVFFKSVFKVLPLWVADGRHHRSCEGGDALTQVVVDW